MWILCKPTGGWNDHNIYDRQLDTNKRLIHQSERRARFAGGLIFKASHISLGILLWHCKSFSCGSSYWKLEHPWRLSLHSLKRQPSPPQKQIESLTHVCITVSARVLSASVHAVESPVGKFIRSQLFDDIHTGRSEYPSPCQAMRFGSLDSSIRAMRIGTP